jgi:hypothetical protein
MKEKTKEIADSVGAVYPVLFMGRHDGVLFTETELETFVALVAKHEREECAKLCETPIDEIQITDDCAETVYMGATECADAIRARGNT